jgi:hypothetical protein
VSGHIVLLGDSIFDNRSYTQGDPDVVTHLRSVLPEGWKATLRAVDGNTTAHLKAQLARLPDDVSHLVVSIGGNDVLGHFDLLDQRIASTREALLLFGRRAEDFERDYRSAMRAVIDLGLPTTVCTIYNGNFATDEATPARVALTMFNDVILRVAFEQALPVIDLRLVCAEPADYANPIEPSGRGGWKIANAIVAAHGLSKDAGMPARVYRGA